MGYTQGTFGPAPVAEFSEGFIQEALEKYFAENSVRYFMDNLYVFGWESDKLIETKTGYIYEFEIKISKADFKNDFKNKTDKHVILGWKNDSGQVYLPSFLERCKEMEERAKTARYPSGYLTYRQDNEKYFRIERYKRPNKFYYAVPEGLIQPEEVPAYAGLIWVTNTGGLIEKKKAPYIHKDKYNDAELKLGEKFYYHMLDWKRNFWRERRAHDRIAKKIKIEVDRKGQDKPYADLLAERDELKAHYGEAIDKTLWLERERNNDYHYNMAVKNALADIIRQYQPDFKLWDIENKIYNEQKEKNK